MQILSTQVTRATAATGEPIVRLVFQGEGGERIAVDMVSDGRSDRSDKEALERARVMLVQTATFGVDERSSIADSHGSDNGSGAPSPDAENYMFEYRDGEGSRHAPATLLGMDAARAEALRCAVDLLDDDDERHRNGWLIRVYDEAGTCVCSVDAAEAMAERERMQAAINP